jgi:Zn-dependent alcohol dehydrogenases
MGTPDDFKGAYDLIAAGKARPVVDEVFPLADARAAHERMERGEQLGKIVLRIPDERGNRVSRRVDGGELRRGGEVLPRRARAGAARRLQRRGRTRDPACGRPRDARVFDEAQAAKVDAIEAGHRVSGTVRLALEVPDSEETARRLVAAGAVEVAPPVTAPWGDRNARVQAPDGMQLTLFTS